MRQFFAALILGASLALAVSAAFANNNTDLGTTPVRDGATVANVAGSAPQSLSVYQEQREETFGQ